MNSSPSIDSAQLARHYSDFKVTERILLTGHSHQAWPDVAKEGLLECWQDAALAVDEKWGRAFEKADQVRSAFRTLLGGLDGDIALAQNTHDLLVRLLSALDWKHRREVLVTDGEFHTVRRQLLRLEEEGIRIRRVPSQPTATLGSRLAEQIGPDTALVITSTVFFDSGQIACGLPELAKTCARAEVPLLLDTYHQLNVVPFNPAGLESTYIIGGGYKYCQFGEGNCFLRSPADCSLRPVVTGWFADFASLEGAPAPRVEYGSHPGARFAGATYDPVSHYRAARVAAFFREQGLDIIRLRRKSQEQISLLAAEFDRLNFPPEKLTRNAKIALESLAGFLALKTPHAKRLHDELRAREIFTDFRGDILRLGPAPYLTDEQLRRAIQTLGQVAQALV